MKLFEVTVERITVETAVVQVSAESWEHAARKAMAYADGTPDRYEWELDDTQYDTRDIEEGEDEIEDG